MDNIYLKEDDISDIDKLEEYNNEYLTYYKDFIPFATKENYKEILRKNELLKQGIENDGICEIYYWAIENEKIVGHASIRLNPEINDSIMKYCGHIMYGVIPSRRGQGYGTEICHLLIQKMSELGYKEIIVTCNEENRSSSKVIENNSGVLLEVVEPDMINTVHSTKRYRIDVEKSLKNYNSKKQNMIKNR